VRAELNNKQERIYEFEGFRLDATKRLLTDGNGDIVPLMPKAVEILTYLVENSGGVIEKDELMSAVWADTAVEENNLTQNISSLRRALGEKHRENRFIATVPGRGYKFVADVRKIADMPDPAESEQLVQPDEHTRREAAPERSSEKHGSPRPGFWFVTLSLGCLVTVIAIGLYFTVETGADPGGDAPIRSLAVLPFKPLSSDNRNEALELGMADNLISRLSGSDLSVRPLNAVLRYNSLEQDPVAAGADLGAQAILDGYIQTSGGRIRISTRLIRTSDGKQLWTGQFDEQSADIFAVQDSISQRVATALKVKLGLAKRYTENVEAYQDYVKGRYHWSRLSKPDIEKAISYFEQAIEKDPQYALAYVGLAESYYPMALTMELPSRAPMERAKAAAVKAIEIDPDLAEGHAAMGLVNFWYDWDWQASEKEFLAAAKLQENRPHWGYPHLLSNLGRHEEALREIRRSRELDPVNFLVAAIEGQALFFAGRDDEALERLTKTLELNSDLWLTHLFISRVYGRKGMHREAIEAARKAAELSGNSSQANAYLAYAFAQAGDTDNAKRILDEMKRSANNRYVPPYTLAEVYNALGQRENALAALEQAYSEKDVRMVFLKVDPMWNGLRGEPRFIDIMTRMNFE
jgi:DNA-binding winged helix-turn-helix (wHTH) protein/TolB-like protein/Tfp pilus assembly protein PilF